MTLILCFLLLAFAFVCGLSLLPLFKRLLKGELNSETTLVFFSPALFFIAIAPIIYLAYALVNFQASIWVAILLGVVLFSRGLIIWKKELSIVEIKPILVHGTLTVLLINYPFLLHSVPPDVDALMPGFFAFLTKNFSIDQIRLWGEAYGTSQVVPTYGFGVNSAVLSKILGMGIPQAMMVLAHSFVASTLLALVTFVVVALKSHVRLTFPYTLVCLLAFNSSFIWVYGDGSYMRTFPFLLSVVIFFLAALGNRDRVLRYILIGVFQALLVAFHFRFFIWNTIILTLWFLFETYGAKNLKRVVVNYFIMFLASVIAVLPILLPKYEFLAQGLPTGELFDQKHNMPVHILWGQWLRFQGLLLHGLAIFGMIHFLLRGASQGVERRLMQFVCLYYMVFLLLCWDSFVVFVLPFTYNLIYSQVAIIANFTIPKTILSLYSLKIIADYFELLEGNSQKPLALFGVLACGLLSISWWIYQYNLNNPFFLRSILQINCMNFIYSGIAILFGFLLYKKRKLLKFPVFTILVVFLFSSEQSRSRFNYPYVSAADMQVFNWLKNNTNYEDTLVLNYSMGDIDDQVSAKNSSTRPDGLNLRSYARYQGHWLPIVSERHSVFHDINMLGRISKAVIPVEDNHPDLERLDYHYWNPENPDFCSEIKAAKVTHVYVPLFVHLNMEERFKAAACLSVAFESTATTDRYGDPRSKFNRNVVLFRVN